MVEIINPEVEVPSVLTVSASASAETADASNGGGEGPAHLSFVPMENPYGQCMSFAVFRGRVPGLYRSWLVFNTPSLMILPLTFYKRKDCRRMVADCDLPFYLAYRSYDASIAAYRAADIVGLVTRLD